MARMVQLKSGDEEIFEVEEAVMLQSVFVKHMAEDIGTDKPMPLPNDLTSNILAKVIEYCKYHHAESEADNNSNDENIKKRDREFVDVDQKTLFDVLLAANYLDIKSLLDLTCQTVADMIKGKSPEEIRQTFNIKNDFTPEEEEAIRKENAWAFE